MKQLIVRYKVKPDRASENQQYIEKVFEELRRNSPPGFHYASFKQNDGVSFVHIVSVDSDDDPLPNLPAFQAFQAGIKDRCEEQPVVTLVEVVGSYRFFDN